MRRASFLLVTLCMAGDSAPCSDRGERWFSSPHERVGRMASFCGVDSDEEGPDVAGVRVGDMSNVADGA